MDALPGKDAMFDLEALRREITAADPIRLVLTTQEALYLLGALQLALRHPGFWGPTASQVKVIAEKLTEDLMARGPELGRLARAGWLEVFDTPAEKPACSKPR